MSKTHIHTIVQEPDEQAAVTTAETVFNTLTSDGTVPVFDWYVLPEDPTDAVTDVSNPGVEEEIHRIWEGTLDRLKETTAKDSNVYDPGKAARARLYRLYDGHARPIINRPHYSTVINREDQQYLVTTTVSY